eukprot:1160174-Pelagomonas_calceolata.AAC.6
MAEADVPVPERVHSRQNFPSSLPHEKAPACTEAKGQLLHGICTLQWELNELVAYCPMQQKMCMARKKRGRSEEYPGHNLKDAVVIPGFSRSNHLSSTTLRLKLLASWVDQH